MTQARSALSSVIAFVVLALVLGVCMGAWSLSRPASDAVAPVGGASASAGPSAAASLAPDDLRVFAIGPIPREHRLVFAGENGKERLMLVAPEAQQVIEAARFEGLGAFTSGRGGDIAATPDATTAIVMLEGKDRARVYVIHPVDGKVTSFAIGPADTPRLSADGRRLAYARETGDASRDGVWMMDTTSGSESRLVVSPGGKPPKPGSWSPDGRWLALTGMGGNNIGLFDTQSPATAVVGPGSSVRWHGNELYIANGSTIAGYDVTTRATRTVFDARGAGISRFEPRPSSDEIATIEAAQGVAPAIWLRNGAQDRSLRGADNVIAMWWSVDGAKLYVWDSVEATTMVSDALTGTQAVKFCLRGNISPPCS